MKSLLNFLAIGFLISCTNPEDPIMPETLDENVVKLHQALAGPLVTPLGKLKSESFYYGPETLQSRKDYYYDSQEREFFTVGIRNGDTTNINLNIYLANGMLDKTSVFFPTPSGFSFSHNFQRIYENDGKKISVMIGIEGDYKQYSSYIFDDLGRPISYRRGTDTGFDLHEYLYESENSEMIVGEYYSQTGMTEPFYHYKYNYNDIGLLVAKSLRIISAEYRPAFEYFYNSEGKLREEITNDLYFGTTPIERKEYDYY